MQVVQLGKRSFAFGLTWSDNFGGDAKEAIRDALGDEAGVLYTVIKGEDDVLGYGRVKHKGALYSFAAAAAAADKDAIYVAGLGNGQTWYLVTKRGTIAAGTDRIVDIETALNAVDNLRDLYSDFPVFSSGVDVRGASEFTLEAIASGAKLKPLRKLKTENPVVGLAVLAIVLGGVGYGGWYLILRDEQVQVDPVAELERKRKLYVSQAQTQISTIPRDAGWVVNAFDTARVSFPEQIAGWALEGVSCVPASCSATYAVAKDAEGYALSPIWEAFGQVRVALMPDKKSLTVSQALPTVDVLSYSEQEVMQPPKTTGRIIDTIGRIGMTFGDVRIDGDYKTDNLHVNLQANPGTAPLYRETFALRNDDTLSEIRVKGLAAYMSEAQFVATSLNFSTGSGSITPAWRIEWTRVHGGEL